MPTTSSAKARPQRAAKGEAAAPRARDLRVLVMAHSDPRLTHGGAEIAAFRLYEQLASTPGVQAWFLGCDARGGGRDGVAIAQPFGAREYVYTPLNQFDWFKFANRDPRLPREFAALLRALRPDVVHLHHYAQFGVEILAQIKRELPSCRVVMTLHEFQAICNHFGQMVKRPQFTLCTKASLTACHACFPEIDAADFFIRKRYVDLFFAHVDAFVSPSHFLAARYVDWGIARERMHVIENLTAPVAAAPAAVPFAGDTLKLGFFGQISKLKGIDVLLDCARLLAEWEDWRVVFEINGDYTSQPASLRASFEQALGGLGRNLVYRGPYAQDQVDRLMGGVDAVLVPSIWWENAPVVIEEALRNRRPVICSDIGGMAEKIRDGIDGFHFPAGSALGLARLLRQLTAEPGLLQGVAATQRHPAQPAAIVAQHLLAYGHAALHNDANSGAEALAH